MGGTAERATHRPGIRSAARTQQGPEGPEHVLTLPASISHSSHGSQFIKPTSDPN